MDFLESKNKLNDHILELAFKTEVLNHSYNLAYFDTELLAKHLNFNIESYYDESDKLDYQMPEKFVNNNSDKTMYFLWYRSPVGFHIYSLHKK